MGKPFEYSVRVWTARGDYVKDRLADTLAHLYEEGMIENHPDGGSQGWELFSGGATGDETIKAVFTLRQASLVRGALMAYRSAIEHVAADLRPNPDYRATLMELIDAKLAVEMAVARAQETA